jgi:hypothetical protein
MASHPSRRKPRKKAKKRVQPLSNAKLLKLAQKHRPPQSWFDQTDLPFVPTRD